MKLCLLILLNLILSTCSEKKIGEHYGQDFTLKTGLDFKTAVNDLSLDSSKYVRLNNCDILNSCSMKGCWIDIGDNSEHFIASFLNESFTLPLTFAYKKADIEGTLRKKATPASVLAEIPNSKTYSLEFVATSIRLY